MRMRGYGRPRVLIFLVHISRIGIGGRHGRNMTRGISLYIFLIISWTRKTTTSICMVA